ncbi:hypothetical protein [Streptomyces zagrosensis]|uniref:hypothetical protein n=1 Tax=Streptomyces zagrosensis TaxID=1042984 RepID=UPI001611835A|nr:hypothetical protein [Streptomyces zagrosensis]
MVISISVLLLLIVLTVTFLRGGNLRVSHAVVCALLGFYLASSSMAPSINEGLTTTAEFVNSVQP